MKKPKTNNKTNKETKEKCSGKYVIWGRETSDLMLHMLTINDHTLSVDCDS